MTCPGITFEVISGITHPIGPRPLRHPGPYTEAVPSLPGMILGPLSIYPVDVSRMHGIPATAKKASISGSAIGVCPRVPPAVMYCLVGLASGYLRTAEYYLEKYHHLTDAEEQPQILSELP